MANLFNITVPSDSLILDAKRTGQITFTVSNTAGRPLSVEAEVTPSDASIQSWFQIDQGASRHLNANETIQYTVTVHVPDNAAPRDYIFHLVVAEETNPDDNFGDSPSIKVTVPPLTAPPAPKPFPWWIVAAAAVVVILIVAIIVIVVNNNNQRINTENTSTALFLNQQAATQTAQFLSQQAASATAVFLSQQAATQTAAFLTQQSAIQTAQFIAQQGATQTAQFLNEHALTLTVEDLQTKTAVAIFATQTQLARPTATPTPHPPATITVSNSGGFFAQFTVSYNSGCVFQSQTSGQFGAGSSQSITIPGDSTSITVQIQDNTGFGLRNSCDAFILSTAQNANYNVTGTTFISSCSQQ